MSRRSWSRGCVATAVALASVASLATAGAASAHGHAVSRGQSHHHGQPGHWHPVGGHDGNPSGPPSQNSLAPQVIHTGTAPTGYEVTFHYYDPTATSVQIRGEWYFSSPSGTTTTSSQGLLPSQWAPGDFPIAYPNQGAAPNWPVSAMTFDSSTGVWSYTTPLPSGTFTYGFYVNCTAAAPAMTGCTELSDPSNPPWNQSGSTVTGSTEPDSEVYVPSDPRFGTQDLSWEQPHPGAGQLQDVSYPDPQSTDPVGSHPLAVFLPPGYNPNRSTPYPTLYLSHGAGGNEVDWSTQGAANSILVNLMAEHKVQPMVIVMTDFNNLGTCTGQDLSCYQTDINDYVVPYVQSHYNVSKNPSDMAFGGLSAGGERANYLLFNDTDEFGYMASWSIGSGGAPATTSPLWTNPDLKTRLGLVIGGGLYDSITQGTIASYEANLTSFGIPFTDDQIAGGHEWYTWRQLLYDYLTKVAFRTTTTSVSVGATGTSTGTGGPGGGSQDGWKRGHAVKTDWSAGNGSGYGGHGGYGQAGSGTGGNGNCHGGGSGPGHSGWGGGGWGGGGGGAGGWGGGGGGAGGWGGGGGGASEGTSVSATVAPATTETTAPTGTVQFSVNGQPSGQPVPVVNGVAQTTIENLPAGASITAAYSGDSFYNASTSAATSQISTS